MRRTGSSCLLRPKNSLSTEDLAKLAAEDPPTATVLTVTRLPTYITDRDYTLSELQVHAHSIRFLCDLPVVRSDSDQIANDSPHLPPSIILYLLWKPNTYPTPRSFADGPLSESVRQCLLANGDSVTQEEMERVCSTPRSSPYSPRRQHLSPQTQNQLKKNCSPPLSMDDEIDGKSQTKFNAGSNQGDQSSNSNGCINFSESNDGSSATPPTSPISSRLKRTSSSRFSNDQQQLTRIYVVVDRVSSPGPDDQFPGLVELPNIPDLNCSSYEEMRIQNQMMSKGSEEQKQQHLLNQHNQEIKTAESLARAVASSRFLRNRIDGISVGITADERAAPGLEACLDAVGRGAKERRKVAKNVPWSMNNKKSNKQTHQQQLIMEMQNGPVLSGSYSCDECPNGIDRGDDKMQMFLRKENSLQPLRERSPKCSPIAIVACQPDDLEGMNHDHHHHHHNDDTDASQKLLQSRISAEWNGKGDYKTFSDRAMSDYRQVWYAHASGNVSLHGDGGGSGWRRFGRKKPKVPRISKNGADEANEDEYDVDESISNAMVIAFLVLVVAYVWKYYGNAILWFLYADERAAL